MTDITGVTASAIKNQALFELGFVDDIDFTSVTDTTVKKVNRIYDTCLLNVLSSYRWRFATLRASLCTDQSSTFTVVAATDILTSASISFADAHQVTLTTTNTLPAGLSTGTTYYTTTSSLLTCKLSLTLGGSAVDVTDAGTGTHTIAYKAYAIATDAWKYKYLFPLPSDMLTYNKSFTDAGYDSYIRYFETNQFFLNTDEIKAYLMYTALVSETLFPQYFINYFKYRLAMDLCFNLTGDTNLLQILAEQERRKLIKSKNIDARQASVKTIKSSPFTGIR